MKVYGIFKNKSKIKSYIWNSVKSFEKTNSWVDPKFICIITSKQLIKYYSEPYKSGFIVHTEEQIEAHNILYGFYKIENNK